MKCNNRRIGILPVINAIPHAPILAYASGFRQNTRSTRERLPILLILLVTLVFTGCNSHPEVTSPESLVLIKQVYTACNTKNAQRLTAAKAELDELTEAGALSQAEIKSFQRIIAMAEDGDWENAQKQALRFAQAQVR